MENFLNPYDKEYMRLAILKHEETFKHQVHELHRLYRIQKLLMRNIANERRPNSSQLQTTQDNNIHFADKKLDLETRPSDHEDHHTAAEDESEIELTLGPSNYCKRRKNRKNTGGTPLTSDHSGATFSSSSTGSSHNRTSCLLSHNAKLNTKSEDDELGLFQVPNLTLDYQNQSHNDQKLRQPPWLFQVLSLNMTTN
ncbi:hypothetical protein M5689_012866 [Euphorbia peplus]|nr:hypothetical protein M5689_012866 [Euphorbia peplus]